MLSEILFMVASICMESRLFLLVRNPMVNFLALDGFSSHLRLLDHEIKRVRGTGLLIRGI
jgi:hypothetical protein